MVRLTIALVFWSSLGAFSDAHEMRPAYLEITEISAEKYDVFWKVPARGETERLSLYVEFAPDSRVISEPVSGMLGGSYFERWQIERVGGLAGTTVMIRGLSRTFTDVLAKVNMMELNPQSVLLKPENPQFVVAQKLYPREIMRSYVLWGFEHILMGVDHLLFVLGLILLVNSRWMLVKTVTSFTLAHSITLAMASLSWIRVPGPPVEAAIALSIFFLGIEIARKWKGRTSLTIAHPWIVAFAFGLLHGIAFASGLSLLGVPRSEIPLALFSFNVGVEIGQLAFVAFALAVGSLIKLTGWHLYTPVLRMPGYAIGILGAFWSLERIFPVLGLG